MGTSNYSDEFKHDAVQQIRVSGYLVWEVSQRLGVSSHWLHKWMKLFAEPATKTSGVDHEAENRRLKRELARWVTEERIKRLMQILKAYDRTRCGRRSKTLGS